jgi:hypothetical protein
MFLPRNRHLLVEPVPVGYGAPDDSSSGVLLPDDYAPVQEHETAEVLSVAEDCEKFSYDAVGHCVVFPGNMMKAVSVGNDTFYLVQENYVMGIYVPEEGTGDV